MSIDQQRCAGFVALLVMASEMDFFDARKRKRIKIKLRAGAMIFCLHEHVVDVEQEPAAGAARNFGEKCRLRYIAFLELEIGRCLVSPCSMSATIAAAR